jgi:transposase
MDKQYFPVAIDVSQEELVAAAPGASVKTFANSKPGIKRLFAWAAKEAGELQPWFVLESSGVYSTFAAMNLYTRHSARLTIANPRRIRHHASGAGFRSKTDRQDALAILDYAQARKLRPWRPAAKALRQLRLLVDHVCRLQKQVQKVGNWEHALGYETDVPKEIAQANRRLVSSIERQINRLNKAAMELVKSDEELNTQVELLKTITSVADASAWRILAYTRGAITDYSDKQLTAHAGLAPAQQASGSSVRGQSKIDKQGCAPLRRTLYMCSLSAAINNPPLRDFYERLITRKNNPLKPRQARVAVMRKLLLIARAVLVSGKPFDPDYGRSAA